jgi:vitamin B12 transporter
MRFKLILYSKLRCLILLFVIMGSCDVVAQSITDTIFQVSDVVVTTSRNQYFGTDVKTEVFTRNELDKYAGEPLSRFLASNTALNIKAYGAGGGLANVTLRGTTSNHVQVNWNGFPINSVTLGSCDFSMIPSGGFDNVSVVYGASGALYGSGTFGGAINLDNNLKTEKTLGGSAQVGYQSLNALNGNLSFHLGNGKVVWKMSAWGANSENKFTYYDYINQYKRTQTDGAWHDAGIIQNMVVKPTPLSTLEAGVWYQVKAYHIPSHIGSTSYEFQKDSTLKLFASFKTHGDHWGLQVKAAMFDDVQNYWQKTSAKSSVNSIESRISARQWYSDVNFRYYLTHWLSFDAGATGTYIAADVSAYGDVKKEKGLAAFAGLKYTKKRLLLQSILRKEWSNNFQSDLLPSVGATWQLAPDNLKIRANVSGKFRKPTFNDLYWMPGGNLNLKPEEGYSAEVGSSAIVWKNKQAQMSLDLSLYWSEVNNMIAWRPSGVYWSVINYQRMHSVGMDAKLLFDIQRRHWYYHSSLMLTLNRAMTQTNSGDKEKVMTYSPRVITAWENSFTVGIWDFSIWHHFTADRFYDDNALLAPYQTIDILAGAKIPVGKGKLGVHATIYNLTNTTYELVRLYPMPGRYWTTKLSYSF